MASASPTAMAAVMLEVGVRFMGQASSRTLTSSTTHWRASVDWGFAGHQDDGNSQPLESRDMASISSVSRFDSASTTSPRDHPGSPCTPRLDGESKRGCRSRPTSRNLSPDQPRCYHARDDDPPGAFPEVSTATSKRSSSRSIQLKDGRRLHTQNTLGQAAGVAHGRSAARIAITSSSRRGN
jgi:hypothetical protein